MHDIRQVFNSLYQEIVLGDRLGHTEYIGLLECVATNEMACHLPGNCHQRRGVHESSSKSGDQIRGTGTDGVRAHASPAMDTSTDMRGTWAEVLVSRQTVRNTRGVSE